MWRSIFGPRREEVTGDRRTLHNEEINIVEPVINGTWM
jgi:hypothetical protein